MAKHPERLDLVIALLGGAADGAVHPVLGFRMDVPPHEGLAELGRFLVMLAGAFQGLLSLRHVGVGGDFLQFVGPHQFSHSPPHRLIVDAH